MNLNSLWPSYICVFVRLGAHGGNIEAGSKGRRTQEFEKGSMIKREENALVFTNMIWVSLKTNPKFLISFSLKYLTL